jgi:zinc finger protein
MKEEDSNILDKQPCPMCHTKNLKLTEIKKEIPFFGPCYIFSMQCSNCDYHMSDVEFEEKNEPVKFSFEVENEDDLNIRVVKSSAATIKIPRMIEVSPGPISNGFVTNIEGIINRIKNILEAQRDETDDKSERNSAKRKLKKLQRVLWGREKLKIQIEDPSGNSAILSDKAKKEKI